MDEEIKDIPEADVHTIVNQFVLAGKTTISATRQDDGRWTVVGS